MEFTSSLKTDRDFRRVYRKGTSAVRPCVVVYVRRAGRKENRLGLTVSTKVGKAHTRNLIRRRLREIYRLHESGILPGCDIVVVARNRAASADYWRLEKEFLSACQELGACMKKTIQSQEALG